MQTNPFLFNYLTQCESIRELTSSRIDKHNQWNQNYEILISSHPVGMWEYVWNINSHYLCK